MSDRIKITGKEIQLIKDSGCSIGEGQDYDEVRLAKIENQILSDQKKLDSLKGSDVPMEFPIFKNMESDPSYKDRFLYNHDGTKMYLIDFNTFVMYEYDLAIKRKVETAAYSKTYKLIETWC